jgi:DNA-binding transcriptional MerR regulator
MTTTTAMTVGATAKLAGVSVRTLHHYDEIGLVVPSARSGAGYRLYGPEDVARLQEALLFRELGFALDGIKRIVNEPSYRRITALQRQRELLEAKTERLMAMIDAVDAAVDAERRGITMANDEMLGVFGDFDPSEYEKEAKERWGDTDAYRQSAQRTARYTREDWERIKTEANEIYTAMAELMQAGASADGAEAMDVAERHRAHLSTWFYDCSKARHVGLGQMYVADPRFTATIDEFGAGLAGFLSAAIAANAER